MNNTTRLLIAATVVMSLAACTKKVKEVPPQETAPAEPVTTAPIDTTPGRYSPSDLDTDACLRQRVVYFDFDQDTLKPEFQAAIACHAKYLRDRPEARMNMEGNADERGTREYNLGLGERFCRPDHRDQLRRRAPDLRRLDRGLLGPESSRRNRLHHALTDDCIEASDCLRGAARLFGGGARVRAKAEPG